jgi:hypothetical protein
MTLCQERIILRVKMESDYGRKSGKIVEETLHDLPYSHIPQLIM